MALSGALEAESDRLSLWVPVVFAGGILIYFGLPDEPRILYAPAWTEDGVLALPPATRANYSVDNWLLADGENREAAEVAANSPFRCDLLGCIGKVKGETIALIRHPAALEEDYPTPTSSSRPFSVGKGWSTARVVVDRRVLQAEGAHALYIERAVDPPRKRCRDAGEGPRCGR